jgi:hypothetical protein
MGQGRRRSTRQGQGRPWSNTRQPLSIVLTTNALEQQSTERRKENLGYREDRDLDVRGESLDLQWGDDS